MMRIQDAPARFLLAILTAAALGVPARADTVLLKNGNRLEGTITEDSLEKEGYLVLRIDGAGSIILKSTVIESVVKGPAPRRPAVSGPVIPPGPREFVEVTLKDGSKFYGGATLYGSVSPRSDDKTLVLELPSGGEVRLPQDAVKSTRKVDSLPALAPREGAPAEEAGPRVIRTTHVVRLKNGRRLAGVLVETPETEPLKLRIGGLGTVIIDRANVERVEAQEGEISLPPPSEAPPAEAEEAPPPGREIPEDLREELKREIKRELLRELLDGIIEEKLDAILERQTTGGLFLPEQTELTNDEILEIQDAVRELTRERSRNRVRAERLLVEMGSAALPYLEPAAQHPFELTRRAAQRIVRDIGDFRGAPIAIGGLIDPDYFVREHAGEALRELFPDADVAHHPNAPASALAAAQEAYRLLWKEAMLDQLAAAP